MPDATSVESLLAVEGLGKTYPGAVPTVALRDVTFSVAPGEFAAVVGRSGSGKSTLLNLIGLLDTPTQGSLRLAGQEVAGVGRAARARLRNRFLGFVFQYHHLLPEFSVRENLLLPVWIGGDAGPPADLAARADEILGLLGLDAVSDKSADDLSGGQRQRVAIGRALMNRPSLVLADEPTGNLDTENGEAVYRLFRRINVEWGTSFLIVTHDRQIAAMTDRVLEVADGRLAQDVPNAYAATSSR